MKTPYALIKDEKSAVKEYKRLAKANRRLGRNDIAKEFDELARSEAGHKKKLMRIYHYA